jgi:diguanylate cyclase (GGDEF)-like protein
MRLHIIGRHDSLLFAGLTFSLLVIFQTPIQRGLDVARDIDRTYGVALIPALFILCVMFVFHQYGKRREMKAEAAAVRVEAALAHARTEELEQLMLFGQALARALTTDALREAVWRYLPVLSNGQDAWVTLRVDAGWERLTDTGCSRWETGAIEAIAEEFSGRTLDDRQRAEGADTGDHVCFALPVGDRLVGVLGVQHQAMDPAARQKLGAAAALLTIAVKNSQLFAAVRDHSVKDALTGCFNRTHAVDILESELARSRRSGTPLSIVLFDVDFFKRINDSYGHACGDSVLATVGQRIRQVLRRSDVRCRYGGDEFLIVLPETPANGAVRAAEWIRSEMEQILLSPRGDRLTISISAGVATTYNGALTAPVLIEQADRALYQAKAHGRNCVRRAAETPVYVPEEDVMLPGLMH